MTVGGIVQRQAGIERDDGAAGLSQLAMGVFFRVRFTGDLTVQDANLIGAYNEVVWVARGKGLRLCLRQTQHQLAGGKGGADGAGVPKCRGRAAT